MPVPYGSVNDVGREALFAKEPFLLACLFAFPQVAVNITQIISNDKYALLKQKVRKEGTCFTCLGRQRSVEAKFLQKRFDNIVREIQRRFKSDRVVGLSSTTMVALSRILHYCIHENENVELCC